MPSNRRTFFKRFLPSVIAILILSSWMGAQDKPPSVRVLFIGNSYTYFNNLPEMFMKLARSGGRGVETRMVAPGGWRLKDHWERGDALKALHEGKWDFVVLQEQSTLGSNYYLEGRPRIASDQIFRFYAEKWTAEVRKTGATPMLYLTWARKATPEDQAQLSYAYMCAAKENGARVAPVGIAWATVRKQDPSLELFYVDGSHPSPTGSYLAACTIYAAIFHQSPLGLPRIISGVPVNLETAKPEPGKKAVLADLSARQARLIQNAAWAAWQELDKNGGTLDLAPVAAPESPPLPPGAPLTTVPLEGKWTGDLLLFPAPFLPSQMVLRLQRQGSDWKGRLELLFHSEDQKDQSLNLDDLQVGERELFFTDPRALQNLKIHFQGVAASPHELRGIAEATMETGSTVRLFGTWLLRKN